MKLSRFFKLGLIMVLTSTLAYAAPLFPDVPDNHWAKDAVAALAAKGLVEGYPDGTFKGDRSASRWETAMIVARLLAKMEQAHSTFATKAELDELRALVTALQEELGALGVRVENLEENVGRLDSRVSELERITYYGTLETSVVMQSFTNQGVVDNDAQRNGTGVPGTVGYQPYDGLVGTRNAAILRPQIHGIIPTVDYRNGRALTNGTGFSALAILGLNVRVTDDIDAGAEFAAFSSQGDNVVTSYWGVTAPYLSNPFTANAGGTQGLNNVPFTRMTLDRFWTIHRPTNTRVMVGNIDKTEMDDFVYKGQPNLGVFGLRRWPGYGFQVMGEWEVNDDSHLSYEILGTRFGDGVRFGGANYQNYNLAANTAYHYENGEIQLNFSRFAEEAPVGGGPLVTGLTNGINVAYGASGGWSPRQWVNPPGFYAAQLSQFHQLNTGTIGNTVDTRPISGWNGLADNAVGFGAGGGNYGPQSQNTYGVSAFHQFELDENNSVTLRGEYGHSQYKPSRNSAYSSDGDMYLVRLEGSLLDQDLDLGVEYLSIDPNYNPAAWAGNVAGVRFPTDFNFTGVFHLHDFNKYPHNREGIRLNAKYRFFQNTGAIWARAVFLDQKRTSLYDVRVTPNALGAGAPNFPILGFSPGFVDPIFYGFAHPSLYGGQSANSFTAALAPLENPSGSDNEFSFGGFYDFRDAGVKVTASYTRVDLERGTSLAPGFGGSQNRVDLSSDNISFDVAWDASEEVTINGGFDFVASRGHYDPAGLYNAYAVATGQTDFTNIDSEQFIPHLGVDWELAKDTQVNVTMRYYDTQDNVDPSIGTGNANLGQIGSTAHPFDWSGLQVISTFKLHF